MSVMDGKGDSSFAFRVFMTNLPVVLIFLLSGSVVMVIGGIVCSTFSALSSYSLVVVGGLIAVSAF